MENLFDAWWWPWSKSKITNSNSNNNNNHNNNNSSNDSNKTENITIKIPLKKAITRTTTVTTTTASSTTTANTTVGTSSLNGSDDVHQSISSTIMTESSSAVTARTTSSPSSSPSTSTSSPSSFLSSFTDYIYDEFFNFNETIFDSSDPSKTSSDNNNNNNNNNSNNNSDPYNDYYNNSSNITNGNDLLKCYNNTINWQKCLNNFYNKYNLSELILNINSGNDSTIMIYSNNSNINSSDISDNSILFGVNDSFFINQSVVIMNSGNSNNNGVYGNGLIFHDGRNNDNISTIELETTIQLISMISTAVVLAVIILATVIGNVFVIAAILLERNLQSVANYLILSLAVADLLVACLVMPLGAVYEVSQEWRLGPELCDMWTSSDVLCCTASILHLVCIALDRYWAVTNIDYVHQRTARRIGLMILVVWALSFLVSIAPLLGWKDPNWEIRLNNLQCIVSQDLGYQIFATTSSFYFPLLVILVLYWRIYQTARKRIRRRQQAVQTHPEPLANASCLALTPIGFRWKVSGAQQMPPGGMIASAAGGSGGIAAAVVAVIGRPLPTISETTTAFTNVSSTNTSPEKGSLGNGVDRIENDPPTADISVTYPAHGGPPSILRPSLITRKKTQSSADSKRERKAAKTLAIITGAFVCCWLPFFIVAILLPTCSSCDISPLIISFFLWLGYFNSTLNPIIYTIFSPEFRHAFKRILCGRRNSIRRRNRHMGVRR